MIYFTSDTHFDHTGILHLVSRPFKDTREMNERILENFNARLKPEDHLYHLGDIAWNNDSLHWFLDGLKCKQVHFCYGNHDSRQLRNSLKKHKKVVEADHILTVKKNGVKMMLCHYPMHSWSGNFHLYGHRHSKPGDSVHYRSLDVGVDGNNFELWSWDEIVALLQARVQLLG